MSNKQNGTRFEQTVANYLSSCGFWVHLLQQDTGGQPADMIAVRGGQAYLIDAKNCDGNRFTLSRIEPNQDGAMYVWNKCGNGAGWFAVGLNDHIYMVSMTAIQMQSKSSMSERDLDQFGCRIGEWVERCT